MTKLTKEQEERFDKEDFNWDHPNVATAVKQFLADELQRQREDILKEIETYDYFDYWEGEYPEPSYVIECIVKDLIESTDKLNEDE